MPPWTGHALIAIEEFDALARANAFADGPYVSTFGDGYGDYYCPEKTVWGTLADGRRVRSVKVPKGGGHHA